MSICYCDSVIVIVIFDLFSQQVYEAFEIQLAPRKNPIDWIGVTRQIGMKKIGPICHCLLALTAIFHLNCWTTLAASPSVGNEAFGKLICFVFS